MYKLIFVYNDEIDVRSYEKTFKSKEELNNFIEDNCDDICVITIIK